MILWAVGRKGSGKSLFLMHQIYAELVEGNRIVVTTLAVDVQKLAEYCAEKTGEKELRVLERVRRITGREMQHFWRIRDIEGEWSPFPGVGDADVGPWGDVRRGVFYVLDEAQGAFASRNWQKTGQECIDYCAQERKLGDTVWLSTPHTSLVDKVFRSLADGCFVLENWAKRRYGVFRLGSKMKWKEYVTVPPEPREPSTGGGSQVVDVSGLAGCYSTEEGLGIKGVGADKGKKARGIPIVFLWGAIGVACLGLFLGFRWLMGWGGASAKLTNMVQLKVGAGRSATNAPVGVPVVADAATNAVVITGPAIKGAMNAAYGVPGEVRCVGYAECGAFGCITLEDGVVVWGGRIVRTGTLLVMDGQSFRLVGVPKSAVVAEVKPGGVKQVEADVSKPSFMAH